MMKRLRLIPGSTRRERKCCCSWCRGWSPLSLGAMLAPRYVYIEPALAFAPMLSFQVVIMALLGGPGRLWGPLVGVIPLTLLWEVISSNFPNQTVLLLGDSFLAIVHVLPKGFVGLIEKARARGTFI